MLFMLPFLIQLKGFTRGHLIMGFPRGSDGKESVCRFDPWIGKIPWKREWLSSSVFLPPHAQALDNQFFLSLDFQNLKIYSWYSLDNVFDVISFLENSHIFFEKNYFLSLFSFSSRILTIGLLPLLSYPIFLSLWCFWLWSRKQSLLTSVF